MWSNELEQALRLAPDHLSIYGLTVEEGTPFAVRYSDKDTLLPDEDLSADMFETADTLLTSGGFEHYEIANYARPGCRARHNSGYWKRDGYLGLGAAAHSFLRSGEYGIRFSNTTDLEEYATNMRNKCLQRHDPMTLTRADALSEFMFLGLRMTDGIQYSEFVHDFNVSMEEVFSAQLNNLKTQGLLEISTQGVQLTRRGMLLSNYVFAQFLA
jgi:oxygen-independent coproporphyrinogen-3 oxidase